MDIVIAIIAIFTASILAAITIVVCINVRSLRERILLLEQVIKDKDNENKKLKMEIYWYLNEMASLEKVKNKYWDELKKVYCSSSHWGNVKSWMNARIYDLIMNPKTLNIPFEEKTEKLFEEHMNNINKK